MEYLSKSDFIIINRMTITQHGGSFVEPNNFLNEGSLDYIVEAAEGEMFGKPLYDSIPSVAALYFHGIISNHVFQDGNKRTGLSSAVLFLRLNGFKLKEGNIGKEFLSRYYFTINTASGKFDHPDCLQWFEENIIEI